MAHEREHSTKIKGLMEVTFYYLLLIEFLDFYIVKKVLMYFL